MIKPHVLLKPSPTSTRLLVTTPGDEVLKASLPPPRQGHPRAAATLLEGLSLWLQRPLSVVLCADVGGDSYALGLCDAFGFGLTTAHYEVEVIETATRRPGLGSFADMRRQLALRGQR
jgi:hypothetical protein